MYSVYRRCIRDVQCVQEMYRRCIIEVYRGCIVCIGEVYRRCIGDVLQRYIGDVQCVQEMYKGCIGDVLQRYIGECIGDVQGKGTTHLGVCRSSFLSIIIKDAGVRGCNGVFDPSNRVDVCLSNESLRVPSPPPPTPPSPCTCLHLAIKVSVIGSMLCPIKDEVFPYSV